MKKIIKAAVLGCTGYTGLKLIKILNQHPNVVINFLGSESHSGEYINKFDHRLKDVSLPKLNLIKNINFSKVDVVFFALPPNVSQSIIKDHFGKSIFIDLSADFRFDNSINYKNTYKIKHQCPSFLKHFIYGLPEINYKIIQKSKNIALPGCYPTSVLLPLIPLLENRLILSKNIIIDSKSGYSGAGKKFNIKNLIKNNNFNFYNYNTNCHRHILEIHQELKKHSKSEINFSFNPHILPIFQGMMSTIYCELNKGVKKEDIMKTYIKEYSDKKFIKILKENEKADFFCVNNTNNCLIKLFNHYDKQRIIIVSLIDNLIKGASGQAVQCMNIMFGIKENIGLKKL